jgi:hypothetical protein
LRACQLKKKGVTTVFDFNSILNWKLLAGSHEFPGPAGGTCINEAAVVAAGFAYREISSPNDCPPCFSRPLAAYALSLNDRIQDDTLRQTLLMPFVTRLGGSADTDAVEELRATHIVGAVIRRILPPALAFRGLFDVARACRSARTVEEKRTAAAMTIEVIEKIMRVEQSLSCVFDDPLLMMADALRDLLLYETWGRSEPMLRAGDLVYYADMIHGVKCASGRSSGAQSCFIAATAILGEALDVGQKAEPVAVEIVVSRFETAKRVERESDAVKVFASAEAA